MKRKELGLWLEVKSSWRRILIGVILIILAIIIITWNELAAIETTRSLSTVFQDLRVVKDNNHIDPNNEETLVYVTGQVHVDEPLTEPDYGISVPSICLKRRVQMYQWVEEEDLSKELLDRNIYFPEGQYSYRTEWRDRLIDSSTFYVQTGHKNPEKFPIKSRQYVSEVVRIGAYVFSIDVKKKFNDFILITSDERPEKREIKLHAGLYYHASDVWNPEVGNIRVQFSYAGISGDTISIIAKQHGDVLGKDGIILLSNGRVPPDLMIKDQHSRDVWSIRFYRSLGWIFLYTAASFFTIILRFLSRKHKRIYNFLVLDGILSPNIAFASISFVLVISHIWHSYEPSIGLSIVFAFLLPWLIYALYKKCKFRIKKNGNNYKKC